MARQDSRSVVRKWSSAGRRTLASDVVPGSAGASRSGGWLDAEWRGRGLRAGDETAGFPFGVLASGELVGAKLVVEFAGGQDVPAVISSA